MNDRQPTLVHPQTDPNLADDASLVVEQQRFALVPEWVIDAKIPDSSFRLYSTLLRYGASSGQRMPSRQTLARRMQRSVDAVDRALKGLVDAGLISVERRRDGQRNLTNRYYLRTQPPAGPEQAVPAGGSRTSAAIPTVQRADDLVEVGLGRGTSAATPGRGSAATPSRESAARVAGEMRPNREFFTESTTPPPSREASPEPYATSRAKGAKAEGAVTDRLLSDCGITDLPALSSQIEKSRRALGKPTARWSQHCLLAALQLAVRGRGWPAPVAVPALLAVANDPDTHSPMRLAEGGPWWDKTPAQPASRNTAPEDAAELAGLEERLSETDGLRAELQARARKELANEGLPLTRTTVVRRACQILDRKGPTR